MGDERQGLRLPGVRTDNSDGSFDVDYDIPLAFFDCRLDDGVTMHKDIHDTAGEFPAGEEPGHPPGVVGQDVLQALPQPRLRRRHLHRQRHRLPGAGGQAAQVPVPVPRRLGGPHLRVQADELDARARRRPSRSATTATSSRGSTASRTASSACSSPRSPRDGGLLPFPIKRDSFELWPAKRREVIIDFTKYQDGTPTTKGDVIYLTDVMKMPDRPDVEQLLAVLPRPRTTRCRC